MAPAILLRSRPSPRSALWIVSMTSLLFLVTPPAANARHCSCQEEIKDIEARLPQIDATRRAWYSVLADILGQSSSAPQNLKQAAQSFQNNMGWTSTRKVGGLNEKGDVVTDPQFEQEHCDSVIQANQVHEDAHHSYYLHRLLVIAFLDQATLAKVLVKSEIDARDDEEAFLRKALAKAKRECGSWFCRCTQQLFPTAVDCAAGCPRATLSCIAPTCIEHDPKTGKPTGRAY